MWKKIVFWVKSSLETTASFRWNWAWICHSKLGTKMLNMQLRLHEKSTLKTAVCHRAYLAHDMEECPPTPPLPSKLHPFSMKIGQQALEFHGETFHAFTLEFPPSTPLKFQCFLICQWVLCTGTNQAWHRLNPHVGADVCASASMSKHKNLFTNLQPVQGMFLKGVGGKVQVEAKGTLHLPIEDDAGEIHIFQNQGLLFSSRIGAIPSLSPDNGQSRGRKNLVWKMVPNSSPRETSPSSNGTATFTPSPSQWMHPPTFPSSQLHQALKGQQCL